MRSTVLVADVLVYLPSCFFVVFALTRLNRYARPQCGSRSPRTPAAKLTAGGTLILRRTIWLIIRGAGALIPFVNRAFEWGDGIATFLPVLSIAPRRCARLTCFLHPN